MAQPPYDTEKAAHKTKQLFTHQASSTTLCDSLQVEKELIIRTNKKRKSKDENQEGHVNHCCKEVIKLKSKTEVNLLNIIKVILENTCTS